MKNLHQLRSFCWCSSLFKCNLEMTINCFRQVYVLSDENPAVVLLVHTQELAPYDLIKILKDFQFKKTISKGERIHIVICLLAL